MQMLSVYSKKNSWRRFAAKQPTIQTLTDVKSITNGQAWDITPYAWNAVKANTLRNCFAKTPVLPESMRIETKPAPATDIERMHHERSAGRHRLQDQEKSYFKRIVAMTSKGLG
ncbi:hypothetical protein FBU30_010137 [Linnemannia zychae]|nr:hypothetical protein FBU30_010137 [Linnemannia zychae]